jgi:hypothetical protein
LRGDVMSFDEVHCTLYTWSEGYILPLCPFARHGVAVAVFGSLWQSRSRGDLRVQCNWWLCHGQSCRKYEGRNLVGAEKANLELPLEDESSTESSTSLSDSEVTDLCAWFRVTLAEEGEGSQADQSIGRLFRPSWQTTRAVIWDEWCAWLTWRRRSWGIPRTQAAIGS